MFTPAFLLKTEGILLAVALPLLLSISCAPEIKTPVRSGSFSTEQAGRAYRSMSAFLRK